MNQYSLTHLSDDALIRDLKSLVAQDRAMTARLLAHLAEVDERKLYRPAAQSSMEGYCIHVLRFSEEVAHKRVRVARLARRFPRIFDAIADGRLHVSGLVMLARHIRSDNADDLLTAAEGRTLKQIEMLLAERFPQADVPTVLRPLAPAPVVKHGLTQPVEQPTERAGAEQVSARTLDTHSHDIAAPEATIASAPALSAESATVHASASTPPAEPTAASTPSRLKPLAPERFALQVTIGRETHEKLMRAQDLLGHQVRRGDYAAVLDRALDALVAKLEKRKYAATDKPRPGSRRSPEPNRHIPAHVKRAVCQRDGGRCTFHNDRGDRCPEIRGLQYDHEEPLGQGGETSVRNVRLLCHAHNQLEAERAYGEVFMRAKREDARQRAELIRQRGISLAEVAEQLQARTPNPA